MDLELALHVCVKRCRNFSIPFGFLFSVGRVETLEDVALRGGDEVKDARVKTTLREEHRM